MIIHETGEPMRDNTFEVTRQEAALGDESMMRVSFQTGGRHRETWRRPAPTMSKLSPRSVTPVPPCAASALISTTTVSEPPAGTRVSESRRTVWRVRMVLLGALQMVEPGDGPVKTTLRIPQKSVSLACRR